MALTPFSQRLGRSQGRIEALQPLGVVLGDLAPGWHAELRVGDYVEVTQAVDLTGARWVRARLRLRAPQDPRGQAAWEAWLVVDGVRVASAQGWPGRERAQLELWGNVSKLVGEHVIGVRLVLVASAR